MKEKKISWTPSEEEKLKIITGNEEKFLNHAARMRTLTNFLTQAGTTGWQAEIRRAYHLKPGYGDILLCLCRAMFVIGIHDDKGKLLPVPFLRKLRKVYWKRIMELEPKTPGVMSPTDILRELLQRGYYVGKPEKHLKWGLYAKDFGMFQIHSYATREEAQMALKEIGIKNVCKITRL